MNAWRLKEWQYGNWEEDERFLRSPPVIIEERLYNAFEAGADAMYQACKEKLGKLAFLLDRR